MSTIQTAINKLIERDDLAEDESERVMEKIMSGEATPAQIGALLAALRMKGETPTEMASFARAMQKFATRIHPDVDGFLVDTCGTGGDRLNTFNISTSAMFVAAGAGVPIAKHGNRSVTSKSGSADVLEALGVNIELAPDKVEKSIERIGIGFMFAPIFHKAMKHAIGPRKEIKLRTVFNLLGPLTNPAGAKAQAVGIYDHSLTEKIAEVLKKLETERAMVFNGLDGLDEISTLGRTRVSELIDDEIRTYSIQPGDLGIHKAKPEDLSGGDAKENARILLRILHGESGSCRDITLLNAAAAIFVGDESTDLEEGLEIAREAVDSGRAYEKLDQLVRASGGSMTKIEKLEESI